MADLAALLARREALAASRANAPRVVVDQNGERVEFRSDAEIAAAIAFLDREIAAACASAPATTIRFRTSKGL
ncbi:phage head-tail joining protein [Falsiroseomonas sp.]|uniref:phage head-tail joining protein n=1 Tax=Falsiroseomonas sp. TaxID=2870721 RepID=UPI0035667175